jgi:hypothetical protein
MPHRRRSASPSHVLAIGLGEKPIGFAWGLRQPCRIGLGGVPAHADRGPLASLPPLPACVEHPECLVPGAAARVETGLPLGVCDCESTDRKRLGDDHVHLVLAPAPPGHLVLAWLPPASSAGEPMTKLPAATSTIPGQAEQSLKPCTGLSSMGRRSFLSAHGMLGYYLDAIALRHRRDLQVGNLEIVEISDAELGHTDLITQMGAADATRRSPISTRPSSS